VGPLIEVVTWRDGLVAVAPDSDRNGQAVIATLGTRDGTTWRRRSGIPFTGAVHALVADGDVLYLAGWDDGPTILRSTDGGRTWTRTDDAGLLTDEAGAADPFATLDVRGLARGPAGLVAVGSRVHGTDGSESGVAWASPDGIAWRRVAATDRPLLAVASDAARYVAVQGSAIASAGDGGPSASASPTAAVTSGIVSSADGAAWEGASIDLGPGGRIDGVVALGSGGFLAWGVAPGAGGGDGASPVPVGVDSLVPAVWSSADGRSWTREPDLPGAASGLTQVRRLGSGTQAVAAGRDDAGAPAAWIRLTDGGWSRERIARGARSCVRDVAILGATMVAIGGSCQAATPSGRVWTTTVGS
jgi:hypothetical protein